MRAILLAAALALPFLAAHARADNPACAQYQEPLAYNACLAKLGPPASAPRGIAEPRAYAPSRRGARPTGAFAAQRTKGRMRMEFTITPR